MSSLLLILPLSHSDAELAQSKVDLFLKFGPYPGHHLTIMPTDSVPVTVANDMKAKLSVAFDSVEVEPIVTQQKSWPAGPNETFQLAAKYAVKRGLPWWFFEADIDPIAPQWLQKCAAEFESERKGYWGRIVPTRVVTKTPDGQMEYGTEGKHMVGCGIYPPQYGTASVSLPNLNVRYIWAQSEPLRPFDIQLAEEVIHWAHPTELLQHNFKTVNYRVEDGQIVCDNMEGNPPHASHAKPIDSRAVVVHGCKDGSLARLILSGLVLPETPRFTASSEAASPGGNGEVSSSSRPAEVHGSGPPSPPVEEEAKAPAKTPAPSFLAFKVHTLLKDGKARRVKNIAAELQIPEEEIRASIEAEGSGLEITVPQWVRFVNAS